MVFVDNTDTNAALSILARRVAELEQDRAAVLALHRNSSTGICDHCGRRWPCPTARHLKARM